MSGGVSRTVWWDIGKWRVHPVWAAGPEAQALFREMLERAVFADWRVTPADLQSIRVTPEEWARAWPYLEEYFLRDGDDLVYIGTRRLIRRGPRRRWGDQRRRAWIPLSIQREVLERDGHRCRLCGCAERPQLDHIRPWSKGGPDTADNLQVLCQPCNVRKGAS